MIEGVALLGLWLKSVYGRTVSEADGCLSNTAMPVKTLMVLMAEIQFNLSCSQSFRSCSSTPLKTTLSQSARGDISVYCPAAAALCRPFPEKAAHSPFPPNINIRCCLGLILLTIREHPEIFQSENCYSD